MRRELLIALAMVLLAPLTGAGGDALLQGSSQTIYVVRHAERGDMPAGSAPMMGADPDLSEAGRARAASLATVLKDAGITAIFATEYRRTQQTAEPLATALGIRPTVVNVKDSVMMIEKIKSATGPVLVVAHSNTIADVLGRLGISNPPKIADTEFDNLFIVQRAAAPVLLRLHYR